MNIHYLLIVERSLSQFERKVSEHLENGWQLQGGVSVVRVPHKTQDERGQIVEVMVYEYFQAIFRPLN